MKSRTVRMLSLLFALILSFSLATSAYAASSPQVVKSSNSQAVSKPGSVYYFNDGKWDPNYKGIVDIGDKRYLVVNGKIAYEFSGSYTYKGHTYSIKNGLVVK